MPELPTREVVDVLRDWAIQKYKQTTPTDPEGWDWVKGFLQDFYDTNPDHLSQRLQRIP